MIRDFIEKNARWLVAGAILLFAIILLAIFGAPSCSNRQAAEQAKQTTRSGEALGNAAAGAIEKFENRIATDDAIDAEVANAQKEIGNAQSPDAIRGAIIGSVCGSEEHRNDPACAVR